MRDLDGRVAVITGGASGIGLGLARACGASGMKLMLGDIEEQALAAAATALRADGYDVHTHVVDVASADAVEAFADATWSAYGAAHLIANNAGVVARHDAWGSLDDWRWVIDVDLWGVVHGVHAFVPRMLDAGDEGHVVNTASTAGLLGFPGISSYVAAKHAVVGLSQSMHHELRRSPIGVSVLCPGLVDTNINSSERNRPGRAAAPEGSVAGSTFEEAEEVLTPDEVAATVLDAVTEDRFWVLPHAHYGEQALANAQGRISGADPVRPVVRS